MSNEGAVVVPTHGSEGSFVGKDGVKRHFLVLKLPNDSFCIEMRTFWNGEEKEPLVTSLRLGSEAFNALASMLTTFSLNMGDYAVAKQRREEGPND